MRMRWILATGSSNSETSSSSSSQPSSCCLDLHSTSQETQHNNESQNSRLDNRKYRKPRCCRQDVPRDDLVQPVIARVDKRTEDFGCFFAFCWECHCGGSFGEGERSEGRMLVDVNGSSVMVDLRCLPGTGELNPMLAVWSFT